MTKTAQFRLDVLGDRQKRYERQEAEKRLMPGLPVIARINGRNFKALAKGLARPYHEPLARLMIEMAKFVAFETRATVSHTHSDKMTFAWVPQDDQAAMLYGGKTHRWHASLSSLATSYFCKMLPSVLPELAHRHQIFDCLVWQVPDIEIATEHFVFRETLAVEQALSATANAFFDSELRQCDSREKRRMLATRGVDFDSYPSFFTRGSYARRESVVTNLSADVLARIAEANRPQGPVERSEVRDAVLPAVSTVLNLHEVLFSGAEPIQKAIQQ